MGSPRFRYVVVASDLHDRDTVDRLTAPVRTVLERLGGGAVGSSDAEVVEVPQVIVVATGGTERAVLAHAATRPTSEPILLVAHPLHNSLPASLEALARLLADGRRGRIVQVDPAVDDHVDLVTSVDDLVAIAALASTRLGLVGPPSDWLVASVPDLDAVRGRWGIEVVELAGPTPAPDEGAEARDDTRAREVAVALGAAPGHLPECEVLRAARLLPALERVAAEGGVDAVSVRCFDFLGGLGTSGCVALAELNDHGFVAGCEGDIASTVAMIWARVLLGSTTWMANPARIDRNTGSIVLAHCTVAPSLVDDLELHTHFESGLGVGLRGTFAAGPYTLIRLGGADLGRRWIAEGELVGTGAEPDLCRTQMTLEVGPAVGDLLDDPLGNHLVVVPGRHRERLERWWDLAFGDGA